MRRESFPVTFKQKLVLLFLLVASAWASLVNGQPFFMDDTSAYVRGPDFAVVYLLGDKFASSWTQDRTLHRENSRPSNGPSSQEHVRLNSPYERSVLAGRSIYYGALLYLGHLT